MSLCWNEKIECRVFTARYKPGSNRRTKKRNYRKFNLEGVVILVGITDLED
ncbi:unnamed protein product [Meloidogyne enterolobii]|uniref:Uncharacterized protein n=1 Tax=Meloidogyne enterolobii TaxID=390850 RepID=A0ACB1A587_MELEN